MKVSIGKGKNTHAPSTYKGTLVLGSLRGWHTPRACPRSPHPWKQTRKAAFWYPQRGEAVVGEIAHTLQTCWLDSSPSDTMRRGRLQEMGRLCPRKDFLQAVNGKLTWKARTKNTQAIGSWRWGPRAPQFFKKCLRKLLAWNSPRPRA